MIGGGLGLGAGAQAELERLLASLDAMTIDELRDEWRRLLYTEPPRLRAASLIRAELAWVLQARMFGDLDAATKKRLSALARATVSSHAESQKSRLIVGTTLVREWRGREVRVEVVEGGFIFEGVHYKSLSAVACRIAGVRWSGPRFFRLLDDPAQKKSQATT